MRDDKTQFSPLRIVALLFAGWAVIKMSIIGYYPDEVVPLILVPMVIALILLAIDKWVVRARE